MEDRAAWVFGSKWRTYVWTRGEFVQVFGYAEYVRRLMGETRDAQPYRTVSVLGFDSVEAFRAWCREDLRKRP